MISRLRPLFRAHPGQSMLTGMAAVGTLAAGIGLMSSSSYLISWAALRPPILDMLLVIVAVRFFALSRAACRYVERLLSHDLTFKWLMLLRVRVYTLLEPVMPGLLLKERSGDLLNRMSSDVDTLQNDYLRVVLPMLAAVVIVSATVALLHLFSPLLAWTAFFFLFLNGVALPVWTCRRAKGWGIAWTAQQSELSAKLVESIQGMRDLSMLNRDGAACSELNRLNLELADMQYRYAAITGKQETIHAWCAHGGMMTILVLAIPMISQGNLSGIFLALLTLAVLTSFESVQSLGPAFLFNEQTRAAAHRIDTLVSTPSARQAKPLDRKQPQTISFCNVSLVYDADPVVDHIQLDWPAGGRIAIVGPSGAGKSSLVNLLLAFEEPSAGQIKLGEHALQDLHPEEVRTLFSVIPQHTHLFNNTVRDNLLLAKPDAKEEELWHSLEIAQLADSARHWPNELDCLIGEQGTRLSGGERQRLAVARAWLKNAPYCIWDEPTAHLDSQTAEAMMKQLLGNEKNGKSLLWITHQLAAMEQMDHIYVLNNGNIIESGSHQTLLQKNGYYARMLRLQYQLMRM